MYVCCGALWIDVKILCIDIRVDIYMYTRLQHMLLITSTNAYTHYSHTLHSCSSFSYVLGQCESYYFSLLLFFLVHIATVVDIQGKLHQEIICSIQ